jgi:NADP-dependent 3-hydroxy acid dehydrogenase YdfG
MNQPLSGKTAIITGASSGIGRATALKLSQTGAAVVICARRKNRLDELAVEINAQGGKAMAVAADAGAVADIDRVLDQALTWKDGGFKYDIVVVNAGRGLAGGMTDSDESRWQELYQLNVLGAGYLMRRAGQYFAREQRGDVVVIGSVAGKNISSFSSFYSSTKFAVSAMAEGLRREVCPQGVRVSVVMPGLVLTEFQQAAGYDLEDFGKAVARFGELLDPQAIAEGIHWLLTLPPNVNVSDIVIRPTGQDYP